MADESDYWECPQDRKIPMAAWVAAADLPPIEEFRKQTRRLFEWCDIHPCDTSKVHPDTVQALAAVGFRPRYRYKTASLYDVAGMGESPRHWEHWCSDDGVTTGAVEIQTSDHPLQGSPIGAIESRFADGSRLVHIAPPFDERERTEYHPMSASPLAAYLDHRARVAERVDADDRVQSVVEPEDREAYWGYYADHLSSESLAASIAQIKTGKGLVSRWWGMVPIAIVLVLLSAAALGANALWDGALRDWVVVWSPILLVALLPGAFTSYALTVFKGHMNHLDHKYPDEMDEHAGFWLKQRIRERGLTDQIEVGRAKEWYLAGLDAYLPFREKIVLGETTYEKQDPTFWAIAAHELGHALDFKRRRFMRPISMIGRRAMSAFGPWVYAGLLANTFFGSSVANEVLFWLVVATLVGGTVVLIDEALASIIGLRILGADARVTPAMIPDMRRHLGFAFGTYCSSLLGYAVILLGWDAIAAYIEANAAFQPAEPLVPDRAMLGNVLSVALVGLVGYGKFTRMRAEAKSKAEELPTSQKTMFCIQCGERFETGDDECPNDGTLLVDVGADQPDKAAMEGGIVKTVASGCFTLLVTLVVGVAFFLEVWDQPLGGPYRAAVFAFFPTLTICFVPVIAPLALALQIPNFIAKKLGWVPDAPEQQGAARAASAAADVVAEIQVVDPRHRAPWYASAFAPGLAVYTLPLVFMWWAAQV